MKNIEKEWTKYSKEELLKLPERGWNKKSKYRAVLFVNTKQKHDSGYNLFAIIGCEDGTHPTEICGYMDDFKFDPYAKSNQFSDVFNMADIAFDCSMRGVFRMHSRREIWVEHCCSTTNWWLGEAL